MSALGSRLSGRCHTVSAGLSNADGPGNGSTELSVLRASRYSFQILAALPVGAAPNAGAAMHANAINNGVIFI